MSEIDAYIDRIRRLEDQVALLSRHAGIPWDDGRSSGIPPQAIELARAGNKIEAIKYYAQHSGVGLREAKDAIDKLPY
jgi:ribosomal protein L7/L12